MAKTGKTSINEIAPKTQRATVSLILLRRSSGEGAKGFGSDAISSHRPTLSRPDFPLLGEKTLSLYRCSLRTPLTTKSAVRLMANAIANNTKPMVKSTQ